MVRKTSRILFPYIVVLTTIISLTAGFGMMAGLTSWKILLWCVGLCLVVGAGMYTFFEVRRLAGITNPREKAWEEEQADDTTDHVVIVSPGTGEPYPHHEAHDESPGLDQGQLTSRSPEPTPLIEKGPVPPARRTTGPGSLATPGHKQADNAGKQKSSR
jgi:hypothetical protein